MFATVIDDDDGVEIEVEFSTDLIDNAGTSLELCPESDQLRINDREPREVRALGHLYYVVEFSEPQPEVRISLTRGDSEEIVALAQTPPSFVIDGPALESSHSRADDLAIAWSPPWDGQEVELAIEDKIGSDCIEGLGYELVVDDSGSFVLPANTLVSGEGGGSCEVKVSLTRVLESSYPEQLAPSGSITAVVNRRLPFNSVD